MSYDRHEFDVAVVGGGIVGTATAMALSSCGDLSIIVLEAEDRLAAHQTGNNSGVIHSGLYYKPGSLKARNCVEGRNALYRFCAEHDIAHEQCGKLVVAIDASQIPILDELERRGLANGLDGVRRIGPEEMKEREPHIAGIAGLIVPETGIVDFTALTEAYAGEVRTRGGAIRTGARVTRCVRSARGLRMETTAGDIECGYLVNCGGLQSDRVARLCGVDPGVRIIPFRGEYYKIVARSRHLVKHLVYPVPDSRFPFLGVHFTRMIDGGIEAGPNAVLAFKREGYSKGSFSLRDTLSIFSYGGFWRMAARYWRMAAGEFHRSFSKQAFVTALQTLVPEITPDDVYPGGAGVRAQALTAEGKLADDFRIVEADRMVHVVNAPSPAATASLSIGRPIAAMARKNFGLRA